MTRANPADRHEIDHQDDTMTREMITEVLLCVEMRGEDLSQTRE